MEFIFGIIVGVISYHVLSDPKRRASLVAAFKPTKKDDNKPN
jgi:hypothetical protein